MITLICELCFAVKLRTGRFGRDGGMYSSSESESSYVMKSGAQCLVSRPLTQPGHDHVTCKAIMQGYAQTCDALLICLIWPLCSRVADYTDHYRALQSLQYYIKGHPISTSIGLS